MGQSDAHDGSDRFQCSPDVLLKDLWSDWSFESHRGPAAGGTSQTLRRQTSPCRISAPILVLGPSLGGPRASLAGAWDRFKCFPDREPERVKSRRDTPRRLTLLFHARIPFWLKLVPEPATPRPPYSLFSCLAAATDTPAFDTCAALSS